MTNRREAQEIEKRQPEKAVPIKMIEGIPKASELANLNSNSILFDESNGVLHIIGKKYKWKLGGFVKE